MCCHNGKEFAALDRAAEWRASEFKVQGFKADSARDLPRAIAPDKVVGNIIIRCCLPAAEIPFIRCCLPAAYRSSLHSILPNPASLAGTATYEPLEVKLVLG